MVLKLWTQSMDSESEPALALVKVVQSLSPSQQTAIRCHRYCILHTGDTHTSLLLVRTTVAVMLQPIFKQVVVTFKTIALLSPRHLMCCVCARRGRKPVHFFPNMCFARICFHSGWQIERVFSAKTHYLGSMCCPSTRHIVSLHDVILPPYRHYHSVMATLLPTHHSRLPPTSIWAGSQTHHMMGAIDATLQ